MTHRCRDAHLSPLVLKHMHHIMNPLQYESLLPTALFRTACITDDASPFALRSTRNRPRTAVRRGAAWPAERSRSRLVVGERKHGWASQHAVARRGGQGGPDAGCAVVTVSAFPSGVRRPMSDVRCPVSGASVRCSAGPVQVTGIRCGRLSQVSSVQCPASVVFDGNEVVGHGGGAGSRTAGMAGAGVVAPPCPRRRVVCPRLKRPSRLAQAVLGQRRVGFDLVVVGGGWQWARSTGWPTGRGGMRARIARRSAAGGDHAAWSWCGLGPSPLASLRALPAGL
jgi:hypothetical protein